MKLEHNNGKEFLNTSNILISALELKEKGEKIQDIARAAQNAIAFGLAEMAINAAENVGVKLLAVPEEYSIMKQ